MSDEQNKLKSKIEQAEAAVARAQKVYDEAEPGSVKDSCLQLLLAKEASLLAKEKALEQVREKDLLQQRAAAGASPIRAEDGSRLSAFLAEWDEARRKSSIRSAQVSNINTEIWNTVQQTARLTVASYEGSMSPTHTQKFPAFQWDDRYEGTQADRYLPYILQNIKVDSRRWQWVDVQGQKNLLTHVSMHTLGYNFKGTTDMVLCSQNAVRSNIYTSGMRVLLEVKKAPVHDDSYHAMVILLLANSLNPKFKPVVVLTDLRDSWVFFWLEGQCIWHSAQDRPAAAGILEDMLQQEELNNSEVQTLPKEDCDRLGIYKRQILDPNAVGHEDQRDTSLADTIDSLSAEEAAITKVQYMFDLFNQIPGVPMPERIPTSVPYFGNVHVMC